MRECQGLVPKKRITAAEVLEHPWITVGGEASNKLIDSVVLSRREQFMAMNKLKKLSLMMKKSRVTMKAMFANMDTDQSGTITFANYVSLNYFSPSLPESLSLSLSSLRLHEIVPLNAGNVLVIEDSEPAARWLSLINQSLNKCSTTVTNSLHHKASCKSRSTTSSGSIFFQKYSLKAVSNQFRTESKRRLKICNCSSSSELERKNSRDSCFRCQPSYFTDEDLSSEEEEGTSGMVIPEVLTSSSSSSSSGYMMKYGLVASKQMVGIFLTIWVKSELVQHISHMRTSCISRGIMGLGNKGCISVSLSLYKTSFCFICSHLASGEKEGDELRRNLDVIEILKNTQFPRRCKVPNSGVPDRIIDHDRIIWLGDLNYRIALNYAETRKLLEGNDWDTLLSKDQLAIAFSAVVA
ncbi:hypothetical protein Dimus_003009 [Dionaea muscipula]